MPFLQVKIMMSFLFVLCLIIAGLLVRINFFLIFPPLIVAYLIARFTDFTRVSDRECMGIIAVALIAIAVLCWVRHSL